MTAGGLAADRELPFDLDPVIVTASRFDDLAVRIPGNIQTIPKDFIESHGFADIVDLLEAGSGLHFRSISGHATQAEVSMRGFGANSGLRTLILVDGQKLNRPDMGGFNWLQIPLAKIERIEIMPGAYSALYGNQAVAGVIKISTRQGGEEPEALLEVQGGGDRSFTARGSFSGSRGSMTHAWGLEFQRSDGFRENAAFDTRALNGNIGLSLSPYLTARIRASYFDGGQQFPGPLTPELAAQNPRRSLRHGERADEESGTISLQIRRQSEERRYQTLDLSYLRRATDWRLDGLSASAQLSSVFGAPQWVWESNRSKTIAGLEVYSENLGFSRGQGSGRAEPTGRANIERYGWGGFYHHRRELWQSVTVSGGLRLEATEIAVQNSDLDPFDPNPMSPLSTYDEEKSDVGFGASLGVTWQVAQRARAWIRFDRLYRYPAMDEIAAYQGFPLDEEFNHRLQAEEGLSVEAGAFWTWGPVGGRFNFFSQWIDGEIDFDRARNLNVNLPDTRHQGWETRLMLEGKRWHGWLDYTWTDAAFREGIYSGKTRFLVPPHKLSVNAQWRLQDHWSLALKYSFTGAMFEGNDFSNRAQKLAEYQVVQIRVRYRANERFSCFFKVNNLLDERYSTMKVSGVVYPAPGRAVSAGIRIAM